MRTTYTDRYGLFPWAMLFAAVAMALMGYDAFSDGKTTKALLQVLACGCFLSLAAKRLIQIKKAKREGKDPAIMRIVD